MADPLNLQAQKAYLDATGGAISGEVPVGKKVLPPAEAPLKEANRLGLSQPSSTDKQQAQLAALMRQRALAAQLQR